MKVHALDMPFQGVEIREKPNGTGGSRLVFTGYASATERSYEMQDWLGPYTEIVRAGAFAKTLSEAPDTAFLLNHGGATMARTKPGTLHMAEDSTGLLTEAHLDPARSDVQIVRSGVEGGELDEMSFAFRVIRQQWSPDYDQRDILEVSLDHGDVSVVNYGANPHTGGTVGLRARQAATLARSDMPALVRRRAVDQLRAGGLEAGTAETLAHVLQLIAAADGAVDVAQPLLAEVLGVPNPDADAVEQEGAALDLYEFRRRLLAL
ncbi:HK97 family phage prohead protease [Kitasatospora aureofaciens]|uniref:HK97 family phage prohead protease n=1 Tax=Kitasatospora aureofaciens TaxID=1894 RepID=UPI003828FFB4